MNNEKVALIGDLHLGANEHLDCFITYQRNTVKWFYDSCRERGIKKIVFMGDLFHNRKHITLKTLKLFSELIADEGKEFDKIVLLGNHDTYYKNDNELNTLDLLKEHFTLVVTQKPEEMGKFLIVPWINKNNVDDTIKALEESKKPWVLGHLEMKGFEVIRGINCDHSQIDESLFDRFDRVYSGHFHCASQKHNINYIGSILQLNWSDHNENKKMVIIDTATGEEELIYNPYTLYEKVYVEQESDISKINVDNLKDKIVKLYINCKRTIAIEAKIVELSENIISFDVIDNNFILDNININIQSSRMTIRALWQDYMEQSEMPQDDKVVVNKIFEDVYKEVMLESE